MHTHVRTPETFPERNACRENSPLTVPHEWSPTTPECTRKPQSKGQATGQHPPAAPELRRSPYLAVAGVGPVLLKPREDVPEGERTDSIRWGAGQHSPGGCFWGQLWRALFRFTSAGRSQERSALPHKRKRRTFLETWFQSMFWVPVTVMYKQQKLAK